MANLPSPILRIGAHTSAAGGVHHALYEAQSIGANITQLFTANQRRWESKPFTDQQIDLWKKAQAETGIFEAMTHASYLINLASPEGDNLQKSLLAMRMEIERSRALGLKWINFHPGSSVNLSPQEGLDQIIKSLSSLESFMEDDDPWLLLEATAGQGTQLGHRLEQLAYLLSGLKGKLKIGVCVDTCHVFAAGYELRGELAWSSFLKEFDEIVGLEYLQALHINDSLKDCGSHVDRHAALGEGKIGWECFYQIVTDKRTRDLPLFLETPLGVDVWRREIATLREVASKGRGN